MGSIKGLRVAGKVCEDARRRQSSLCRPLLACSLLQSKCLLLFPASADGDADMVALELNWKVKTLAGLTLNQYVFGMMVLIKSCENER